MMISIYEAFDIAFNITAIIPCLALIIIYLILKKDLKYPHYFKLELMFILLVIISLDFASSNFSESPDKDSDNKLKYIKYVFFLIKSYLDIVLSFFLLSFSYLCYTLSKTKKNDLSKSLIIVLSLGSGILPLYRIMFNGTVKDNIDFIVNICVISSIYFLDLIFYILIIVNMCSIKKKDEENNKYYNRNIKRMTLNFMSHLFLCSILLYDLIRRKNLYKKEKKNEILKEKDYLDLLLSLAYNFISYISFLEGKTTDYLKNKFRSCFSFENLNDNVDDDDEESESDDDEDDDEDDIQIFNENDQSIVSEE